MPKDRKHRRKSEVSLRYRTRANIAHAMQGLTEDQRVKVAGEFERIRIREGISRSKGGRFEGWSLFREPSTKNPPHTVRLLHRNYNGQITQVISISEKERL